MKFKNNAIFRKIISREIKNERIKRGYKQNDLAYMCYISPPLLSKIESGDYKFDYTLAKTIFEKLDSSFITDTSIFLDFLKFFDNLYHGIILINNGDIVRSWNLIENNKVDILNSPAKYKYNLYKTVLIQHNRKKVIETDLLKLLECLDYYDNKDKQVLYDNIGIYYKRIKDIENSNKYFKKAIKIPGDELVKAMALHHYGANLIFLKLYGDAFESLKEALSIFEKHNINERMVDCYLIIGYCLSDFKEKEKAVSYFEKAFKLGNEDNKKFALHNILWCYIEEGNDKAFEIIKELNFDDPSEYGLVTYELILKYLFRIKDYVLFDKWYKLSLLCKDNKAIYKSLIELYKSVLKEDDIENIEMIANNILSIAKFPYDKESYSTVYEILAEQYKRIGNYKKAYESNQEIIKIHKA